MAGGSMSLLRRRGKRGGNERIEAAAGHQRGARFNYELLSGDIQTLLQVFHDEANGGKVSF